MAFMQSTLTFCVALKRPRVSLGFRV